MKSWTYFAAGSAVGAVVAGCLVAGVANGDTGDARVAALEARVANLEASVSGTVHPETLSLVAPKHLNATAGKSLTLTAGEGMVVTTAKGLAVSGKTVTISAGDDITLVTGKAQIHMRKSGQIEITGSTINVEGDGDVQVKGRKISQN